METASWPIAELTALTVSASPPIFSLTVRIEETVSSNAADESPTPRESSVTAAFAVLR